MQTFLPHSDFVKSARVLDRKRLGKQRLEVIQILSTLSGASTGWSNHPAVRMWYGNERSLSLYGLVVCDEWIARGYVDNCRTRIQLFYHRYAAQTSVPHWLGDRDFHRSHQSNLLRKLPSHYRQYWPDVPNNLPYVWPTASKRATGKL